MMQTPTQSISQTQQIASEFEILSRFTPCLYNPNQQFSAEDFESLTSNMQTLATHYSSLSMAKKQEKFQELSNRVLRILTHTVHQFQLGNSNELQEHWWELYKAWLEIPDLFLHIDHETLTEQLRKHEENFRSTLISYISEQEKAHQAILSKHAPAYCEGLKNIVRDQKVEIQSMPAELYQYTQAQQIDRHENKVQRVLSFIFQGILDRVFGFMTTRRQKIASALEQRIAQIPNTQPMINLLAEAAGESKNSPSRQAHTPASTTPTLKTQEQATSHSPDANGGYLEFKSC